MSCVGTNEGSETTFEEVCVIGGGEGLSTGLTNELQPCITHPKPPSRTADHLLFRVLDDSVSS